MKHREIDMKTPDEESHADLPVDSDVEVEVTAAGRPHPVTLRWRFLALVAVGGAVGTALRELVSLAIPPVSGVPVAILGINVIGALSLGVLLEALARRGPDEGVRRDLRLLLGTGVLGGFTTYSALATDTARLVEAGEASIAAGYTLGTLVIGALATWVGIALSAAVRRRSRTRQPAAEGPAR